MAGDGTVRVDTGALGGAGRVALDLRGAVVKTSGALQGVSAAAAPGLAGWRTGAGLSRLAAVWDTQSDALAERLGRTGGNLEQTAQRYRGTEQANHAAFGG